MKLVSLYSTIKMMHGTINVSFNLCFNRTFRQQNTNRKQFNYVSPRIAQYLWSITHFIPFISKTEIFKNVGIWIRLVNYVSLL